MASGTRHGWAVFFGLLGLASCASNPPPPEAEHAVVEGCAEPGSGPAQIGTCSPWARLVSSTGDALEWSALRGQVVVLDLGALW
ncbi:hypothetical protein [Plesiocystis pacifica]|uniref:hypothetical protein n=1 Tax=Plesiocystis pacifica TaxID=191768 RepID=UPI0012FB6CEC|nr:hypothetical protein [Plesiocystis pacifica]